MAKGSLHTVFFFVFIGIVAITPLTLVNKAFAVTYTVYDDSIPSLSGLGYTASLPWQSNFYLSSNPAIPTPLSGYNIVDGTVGLQFAVFQDHNLQDNILVNQFVPSDWIEHDISNDTNDGVNKLFTKTVQNRFYTPPPTVSITAGSTTTTAILTPPAALTLYGYPANYFTLDTTFPPIIFDLPIIINPDPLIYYVWRYETDFDNYFFGLEGLCQESVPLSPADLASLAITGVLSYEVTPTGSGPLSSLFSQGASPARLDIDIVQVPPPPPPNAVPEPATMFLLGCGLLGLAGYGRKKLFKK